MELHLSDPEATRALGQALGSALEPGLVVALLGDLGAGKTALSKAAIAAQGEVLEADVASPTYVLAVEYPGRVPVLHVDAYRLGGGEDFDALGYGPLEDGPWAVLIEWAERIDTALPSDRLTIELQHAEVGRSATLTAGGEASTRLLERIAAAQS